MNKPLIIANNVKKVYNLNNQEINALDGLSFEINHGKLVVVVGPSGAGKTTFLNILGGMDRLTSGNLFVGEKEINTFKDRELTKYRRDDIGFVFQFYNLMPNLTALENIELATEICSDALDPLEVLDMVGIKDKANHFPSQLSGGEQQRVSIARALAKNPKLLLCDEPTGALDYETGKNILTLLQELSIKRGRLVVIVTHNSALKQMANQVILIKNGVATENYENDNVTPVKDIHW